MSSAQVDIIQKVHKHVAAIHCSGDLSLFQRKIINCLLFHAFPDFSHRSRFSISIKELLALMGLNNNDYRYLREAFKAIRKTDITWNLTEELFENKVNNSPFESWIECSWLSWAMSDGSTIHYEFPEPLKAYLLDPTVYASISLKIQQRFTSKFALILYENCARYAKIGKSKQFDLATFRSIMGVKKEQYRIFRDFNNRVLKPAMEQVNNLTDIRVEVQLKREKRKVVSLQFTVSQQSNPKEKKQRKSVGQGFEPLICGVARSLIEKHARPGETYEQAAIRLKQKESNAV